MRLLVKLKFGDFSSLVLKEEMVSDFFKKIPSNFLKILGLGCLLVFLALPASAQEKGPKDQETPPPAPPKPVMQPMPAPRMAPPKEHKAEEEQSRARQEETMEQKKVTGSVGGQEIRAKEGPEEK